MFKVINWTKILTCLLLPLALGVTVGCSDTPKGATPPATFHDFPGEDLPDGEKDKGEG